MAPWLGPCTAWILPLQPQGRGCSPNPPSFRCRPLLQHPERSVGPCPLPLRCCFTAAFASSPADASARVFYFFILSFCCSVAVFGHFAARVMRRLPGRIAATAPPAPRTSGVPRPPVPSPVPCPGHSPSWGSAPHPCASGRAAAAAFLPPTAPLPPLALCSPPTLAPSPAPCRCPRSAPWPRGTARSPSLPPCSCPPPGPERCPLPPGAAARRWEPAWPGNCPPHPWVPPHGWWPRCHHRPRERLRAVWGLACSMASAPRNRFKKLQLKQSQILTPPSPALGTFGHRLAPGCAGCQGAGCWGGQDLTAVFFFPLSPQHFKTQGALPRLWAAEGQRAAGSGRATVPRRAEPPQPAQRWVPGGAPASPRPSPR